MDTVNSIKNDSYTEVMLKRQSVRQFQPDVKIPREELMELLKEATTSPSACNLQSWHFVVCDDEAGKQKAHSLVMPFNFPQTDTCSAIVFVLGDTQSHEKYRDVWNKMCADGRITPEKRDEVFQTFLPLYEHADREFLVKDSTIDASMVSMQFLLAARAHGYEANPLAGYNAAKIATTFGLDEKRYVPVMAIAIGKPAEKPIDSIRYDVADLTDFA
ncbi:nitroreductase family protein [Levilactobacillus acidifarinae]|uniref:NADH dehydrogenase n=1 Tax=Levilactobacillus acidifarinae DSM 19394 = JCM 15949 TaxID=1423715 RepID=A0A0R1LEN8_9LACO|nr:nitroreductase family protein [Levilactobacillus acidifarinae]KRK94141.1 NADH dehydrogenase [Levilactobacillus acidifarinae DSM 19394]GEO70601.1 nitroreductase [Levilactobacillus acidifarinae]